MSTRTFTFPCRLRPARLTVCLSIALGLTLSSAHSSDVPAMQMPSTHDRFGSAFDRPSYLHGNAVRQHGAPANTPSQPAAQPHYVTTCGDDANTPGTLRYEVGHAVNGDTVDMSTLACSTITLTTGLPIFVTQGDLHLKGPTPPSHLTIDGNEASIVLAHYGAGTLDISDLTIKNGYFASSFLPTGGCVYSKSNVSLTRSVVTHCVLRSTSNMAPAIGAGVYTHGDLTLSYSTITHSRAFSLSGAGALGGGAAVFGDFKAYHSTISDNSARSTTNISWDGGVHARQNVVMEGSTISGNYAQLDGGIGIVNSGWSATITNSTISSNKAATHYGGIFTKASLTLDNSTIAFNRSYSGSPAFSDGLYSGSPLVLNSSIISGNAGPGGPSDLGGSPAATVTGSDNLITFSTIPTPGGTRTDCPQLEPLANNGGPTLTHALKHTSPAIDNGFAGGLTVDQRLSPRTSGVTADIGSVEWQPGETDERVFVSGFDGLCDQ